MAAPGQALRIVCIATFVPAFPILIAHGVISCMPAPATGLVPLAFSAGVCLFLVLRQQRQHSADDDDEEHHGPHDPAEAGPAEASQAPDAQHSDPYTHPILVFFVDAVLAAALLVVAIVTWIQAPELSRCRLSSRRQLVEIIMLAAYGTIPLLINFFIHLYFAVRGLSTGLALPDLTKWLAWQIAAPTECPDCHARLQPDSLPAIPWFDAVRKARFQLPAMPQVKAPQWKAPAWWKGRGQGQDASLFVDDAEEARYRDEPETGAAGAGAGAGAAAGEPSTRVEEPDEVAIVGRKDRKARDTAAEAAGGSSEANWQD